MIFQFLFFLFLFRGEFLRETAVCHATHEIGPLPKEEMFEEGREELPEKRNEEVSRLFGQTSV